MPRANGITRQEILTSIKCRGAMTAEELSKELLISPRGLRIVMHVAEVDRLRYMVLREARFDDTVIDAAFTEQAMKVLLALNAELTHEYRH